MARAEGEGRIAGVPYDPAAPVWTSWDLGIRDATAIWSTAWCDGEAGSCIQELGNPVLFYFGRSRQRAKVWCDCSKCRPDAKPQPLCSNWKCWAAELELGPRCPLSSFTDC
jgi:hypothetical protein